MSRIPNLNGFQCGTNSQRPCPSTRPMTALTVCQALASMTKVAGLAVARQACLEHASVHIPLLSFAYNVFDLPGAVILSSAQYVRAGNGPAAALAKSMPHHCLPSWPGNVQCSEAQVAEHVGRRKIKCDETWPICLNCYRAGRQCPGPQAKTQFIDETTKLKKKHHHGKEDDSSKVHTTKPTEKSGGRQVQTSEKAILLKSKS